MIRYHCFQNFETFLSPISFRFYDTLVLLPNLTFSFVYIGHHGTSDKSAEIVASVSGTTEEPTMIEINNTAKPVMKEEAWSEAKHSAEKKIKTRVNENYCKLACTRNTFFLIRFSLE